VNRPNLYMLGEKSIRIVAVPMSDGDPWYRAIDSRGVILGAGERPELAERMTRRELDRRHRRASEAK
jgi:hypothetical protein